MQSGWDGVGGTPQRSECARSSSVYNGPSETCPRGKQRISIDRAQERNVCILLGPAPTGSRPRMCSAATITFLKLRLGGVGAGRVAGVQGRKPVMGRGQEIFNPTRCTPGGTPGCGKGAPFQQMPGRPQESKALWCPARALNCF